MPDQQRKIGDGPVRVKAPRLGRRSGSSWVNGVCRHVVPPSVAKAHHRHDTNAPPYTNESYPHSPTLPDPLGNHCGPDDRDCHTQPRRTFVPMKVATPLAPGCVPGPRHHDGVGMPDAGLHPQREAMHKQHTGPGPSCCVPFSDPHVHKVPRSNETRQGYNHSSANTLGSIPPSREDTPDRRQVQITKKEGGTSTKSSVLLLTCVPLPHLVLPNMR